MSNTNYVGTKRRMTHTGGYVYEVIDQTGLQNVTPSEPGDAMVTLRYNGGRNTETQPVYISMSVRAMLAESVEFRSVTAAQPGNNPTPITGTKTPSNVK